MPRPDATSPSRPSQLEPCSSKQHLVTWLRECELAERLEVGDADADETERPGTVAQSPVEEPAREVADRLGIVDSGRERGRAAADREVRVADLRRHRPGGLSAASEVARDALRHAAQLGVELRRVADVALERLLLADRD